MANDLNLSVGNSKTSASNGRRVLFLSTAMGMGGGAEEQVIALACAFKDRNWQTMIVSMVPLSPMPADFASRDIPLKSLEMKRGFPGPTGLFRLSKIIREFKPDVVHSHMNHANLLARAVRLIQPYPVLICTLHNLTMAGVLKNHTGIFEMAHRITDGLSEQTTAICKAAADYTVEKKAVPPNKMRVVHNGIDISLFQRNEARRNATRQSLGINDEFVWMAAGRLEAQKDYPNMLRAFSSLLNSYKGNPASPKLKLLICGQGSLKDNLVKIGEELNLGDQVRFMGLRSDIPEMMNAADAFVLSSELEGLPLVLLQAAASHLPIVSTDVGGNSDAVINNDNGLLVPSANHELLAQAMKRVNDMSTSERLAMGDRGRTHIEMNFQTDKVVDLWEQMYVNLLAKRQVNQRSANPQVELTGNSAC